MLVGTVVDVLQQALAIVRGHDLGEGQVLCNLLGHTQLIQLNVGIGRDDGSGGEVDALSHQVAAHTPRLCTEPRLQCSKRSAGALGRGFQSLDVVVNIRRNIILQLGGVLVDVLCRVALVDLLSHLVVGTEDVDENVCEIVLHPLVVVHHNRGANRQGRDGEDGADHPLGAGILGIQSNASAVLVRDSLEGAKDQFRLDRDGGRGHVLRRRGVEFALERRRLAQHLGDLLEHWRGTRSTHERLVLLLGGCEVAHLLEPGQSRRLECVNVLRVGEGLGA